jgi:hypothetical protein
MDSNPPDGPYIDQVQRMAFFGFASKGSVVSKIGGMLSSITEWLQIDDVVSSRRLVSIPYKQTYTSGQIQLTVDKGQSKFHSSEMRPTVSYANSQYYLTLQKLNNGYMGCAPGSARTPTDGPNYPCNYP